MSEPDPHRNQPSKPVLQNNIGALMLMKNSPQAAKERFYASIATSISKGSQSSSSPRPSSGIFSLIPENICPKIDVGVPGLVWFEKRLLKEVSNHGCGGLGCHKRNDELETRVPLGLEYFQHPITVSSSPLSWISPVSPGSADVRIAAGVNLALVLFREGHPVEQVLCILQWSIAMKMDMNADAGSNSKDEEKKDNEEFDVKVADPLLLAIAHNNMGVLRFMQHKTRAAMHNFKRSQFILQSLQLETCQRGPSLPCALPSHTANTCNRNNIPIGYLQLTVMLNHTRAAIQLNDERSSQLCEDLITLSNSGFVSQKNSSLSLSPCDQIYNHRIKWLVALSTNYIPGLSNQCEEHNKIALEHYNTILSKARKEWGHDHVHVAAILERKGMVLFDQLKYQNAMLSYLASWRIYEHAGDEYLVEQSRLLYAIGRTLHDREEFADALSTYKRSLALREQVAALSSSSIPRSLMIESIQIWCNVCRIHHIMGDLTLALDANEKIVCMATDMVGGGENAASHAFVRNRMMVLGNFYVEMGRLEDAMEVFSKIARSNRDADWMVTSHARPEVEDVDTNAFAVRAAERLGKLGGKLWPHAAAA